MAQPRFVAGVGASAGGLESLERFFRNVPPDSGLAFIVVQHLSADHKSLMEELIRRFTAIPVSDARDGEELEADHIYLLPPGKELEVHDGRLVVHQRQAERALAFPIDRMLASLADAYGPRALAVILSGSGSDGSRGVRRIEAMGGLVMVEDPALAAFDGMPRAAIDAGAAAAVMSAESLGQAIVEHVQGGSLPEGGEMQAVEEIVALLKTALGAEFEEYKRGTIYRRAMRRARLTAAADLGAYLVRLEQDPTELRALHDDLLVSVTAFFRDPGAFERLAAEVDAMVQGPIEPQRELRAWCAGCASGEEAYSIAMLFDEAIRRAGVSRSFKVFATDIHAGAVDAAGAGVFPPERLKNVSPERRAEYFVQRADGDFQVSPALRNRVVFARHDLLRDTPFTNLDLVVCRNMLIYLKLPAQRRALASLSYGLRVGGLLFLGSSETPGDLAPHYETLGESAKLFRKRVHSRGMHHQRPDIPTRIGRVGPARSDLGRPETRLLPVYDALLEQFMPPSFLISGQRALLDSYAGAARLLHIPERRPTGDFFELVPPSARMVLTGLFVRAVREPGPATAPVSWTAPGGEEGARYLARVQRIEVKHGEPAYVIALSEDRAPAADAAPGVVGDMERAQVLEEELSHARLTLQATVEELEASNEELQATNEELVASNEELQSVNEELHSVNEELHTVNAEHQHKIAQLTELNRDIGHLLESIDVATVYLDRDLRIRKYTPRAAGLFGLVEHDVGRYLASFNHLLHYPTLMDEVAAVREGGPQVEKLVRARDERWYFVRLLPYRIGDGIEGVVVTLTDATALALARERARRLSSIVESSADAIVGMDLEGQITSWNAAAARIYGYQAEELVGRSILTLCPPGEQEATRALLARAGAGEELVNVVVVRQTKAGRLLHVAKTISPVRDAEGVVVGLATIDRDIQAQRELERRMRESELRYEDLYDNAPDMYLSVDTRSGRVQEFNRTFLRVTGHARERIEGMHLLDLCPPHLQDAGREALNRLREGETVSELPLTVLRAGEDELEVSLSSTPILEEQAVVGARVVLRDVSSRREAERKLAQAAQMREQFLAMVSHELRGPLHAISAAFQIIDQPDAPQAARDRSQAVLRRQTRQMIRLVDDLLDVSRIAHGKLHLEHAPLDLASVVRGAFDAVAPAYSAKGVKLISEGLDLELPMFGDAGRLTQVFANLLDNSLRHTPEGRRVHVSCALSGQACAVTIADEGRGIAAEHLRSIFDMFAQSRQGLARSEGGLGLGLTIAERIVAAHGGTITARSDGPGQGASFTVTLTLDPRAVGVDPSPPAHDGRLVIVLVEDQEDAREMMAELLQLEGHEVHAARDGRGGLAMILEHRPQVALLDLGLPHLNGFELARRVREALGPAISLVALSGYGQPEDVRAAQAAGFDCHLAKPVDQRRLCAVLRELSEGSAVPEVTL